MNKPNPNFLFNILGGFMVGYLVCTWGDAKRITDHYKLHHPEIPDKRRIPHFYGKQAPPATPTLGQSYGPHPGYTEPALHPDMPAHQIPRHRPQGRGAPPGQIARVQHHYFGGYETD